MLLYAAGSAGLAALIKPILDSVLPESAADRDHRLGHRRPLPAQGNGVVSLDVSDGGCRPAGGHGSAERALPPHPRSVGGILRAADDRTADVADQQRRRPGPAGRLGDRRRPGAGIARDHRLRGDPFLLRRVAGALLPDQRAADRVSAGPARAARPAIVTAQPGSARAALAHQRRGVRRPSHRQGLRHRSQGSGEVQPRRLPAVPHQHEGHRRGLDAAAAHGAHRRPRHGGRPLVREPRDCGRTVDDGGVHLVHRRAVPDVRTGEETEPRQREPPAGDLRPPSGSSRCSTRTPR